jgi:hypothetical protein
MTTMMETPRELVQSIADMRLPIKMDTRLTHLLDRNNEGDLTLIEREELESLVELSETLSLLRARALQVLGRRPT